MLLLLQPSAAQSSALDAELQNQQTPGNCEYHHWLTAPQFAAAYANSAADANAVAAWLSSQGFQVAPLPASRGWIEFSGTAAQVEQAFHAPVHAYVTAGERRLALAGDLSVPAALVPVIHGLVSLDGALAAPAITATQSISASPAAMAAETSMSRAEALTPQLAAQALDLPSAQSSGARGDGESIAIAARSNIQPQDLAAFRSTFGLPANPVVITSAGADPGLTADQAAAELAASWAGAAAPGARIVVAPAASTAATDGIDLSMAAIVDRALAHTVVIGYSSCEAALSDAHQAWYAALYRQAAAEGISAIVAAGDSGAAACHAAGSSAAVTSGLAVNALASTPWNTAVGAAAFSPAGDATLAAWSPLDAAEPAYAGGGGFSSTYAIPAWQPAFSPTQTGRALPDVALPAALDSAMSRGLAFCFSGSSSASGCNLVRSGGSGAAAAIFGGISALLAQQNGPQGNLAPRLYAVSSSSGVFDDVQQGSARLACAAGSPDCDASGLIGYAAGKGFDLATGLGSPDARNLLSVWARPDVGTTASIATLAVSPVQANAAYNPQATITFTATVTPGAGGATPTGTIDFFDQALSANLNSVPYALDSTGAASITLTGAMPQGGNSIIARYSGDTTYGAQSSQALTVNIQPSTTTTTVSPATNSPTTGTAFNVTATVAIGTPPAGTASPTGKIQLTLDGANYASASASTSGGVTSATFSVTVSSGGSHNLQAIYAGDANYATSTSQPVTVNAGTNNASVALAVAPTQPSATYNPSATLTFTATVSSQSGGATPTGTVNFFDQATGANLNAAPVALTNGIATLTITGGLPQNGNSIFARYLGDTTYAAQSSQALTVNIQPSSTTTTVKPSTATPPAGTAFPVTVTIAIGTPPAGTAAPTGMVNLTLDGAPYASANVTTTAGVTSASFNVTVTGGGGHNLQAIYAGDANYATSTSATVTVTVGKGATVTTLTANLTVLTPGAQETFTATIAASNPAAGATNTFTGSATFFDGATQLGTATVNGNTATLSNVTLSSATTHVITAVYSGDDTWGGSTSNAITLKVVLFPVNVTLTVTPATAAPGQVVTLTATVTPTVAPASAAEQNPTGNIIFYNGTKILATVALSAAINNTSTAQLLFTTLPAGQDVLSAAYIGDLFYAAGTSNAVTITVQDFTITPAATNPPEDLDINKGTSGQASFVITGLGGFNSVISVTCSVPALDDMTCVANPQQLTPTATVTFTVNTFMTGGPSTTAHNQKPLWPPAAGGTALAALLFFLLPWGRRARIFSHRGRRVLLLLLLLGSLAAAGMGCSSISGNVANLSGTPLGQTTLTITAATSIDNTVVSHSTYLSVNVLPPGSTGTSAPVTSAK
jgi:hypothetical protein